VDNRVHNQEKNVDKSNVLESMLGAVARGWCDPKTAHKEMDADLAIAIAHSVIASFPQLSADRGAAVKSCNKCGAQESKINPIEDHEGEPVCANCWCSTEPVEPAAPSGASDAWADAALTLGNEVLPPMQCPDTPERWLAAMRAVLTAAPSGVSDAAVKRAVHVFANQPSGSYDDGAEERLMRAVLEDFARQPQPGRVEGAREQRIVALAEREEVLKDYVADYEYIGETEDGRDACYQPNERERLLIEDAIRGWDALELPTASSQEPDHANG
jgi:hypothetical protein